MANLPTNAPGWEELINGNMINAVYTMFNSAIGGSGLIVVILFFVFQFMLYMKTENVTLTWISGAFFVSVYASSYFYEDFALRIIFALIVFEFAGILYLLFFSRGAK